MFGFFPLLCLFFASLVAFAGPLGLVHLYFPQQDSWAWNDANFQAQAWPTTLLAAKFFVVVLALFFLVVVLFTALGERLGTLFDALSPTRAYTVNLLASLAGIWAFAALTASPGARAHYDRRRAAEDRHVAAQRNLFNRLLGCLHHCLTHRIPYDEQTAFPHTA